MKNNVTEKKLVKCFICQKTEDELLKLKESWKKDIDKELNEIDEKKQFYKDSHGYTSDRFIILKNINKNILSMEIDVFKKQKQEILEKMPKLKFLYDFIAKQKKTKIAKNNIKPFVKTVKDIVRLYISQSENHPHVLEIEKRRGTLLDIKNNIERVYFGINSFSRVGILLDIMKKNELINISENDKIDFGYFCGNEDNEDNINICTFCYGVIKKPLWEYELEIDN